MKHFTDYEFMCKCCGELPPDGMNPVLLEKLDMLRERIDAPIIVTSAYRCPYHNAEVGGVGNSQHVLGNACDVICYSASVDEIAEEAARIGFDGIGVYRDSGFVHLDCRDNGKSPDYYRW